MAPPSPNLPSTISPKPSAAVASNDAMIDLMMERAIDLLRLEAGTRDKIVLLLNDLEIEIAGLVAKIDPSGPARAAYQRQRLGKLLDQVQSSIRATYRLADTKLASEIRDVVDVEATWTANAMNAATHATFADAGITKTLLDTLVSDVLIQGAPTSEWWSRQAAGLDNKFADEMRRGVAIGETNGQLIERVRGVSGIMQISRTSAERLVRSSVQTAANVARESTYSQNSDLIGALQWHATLDTRTTIMCMARDGHRYSVDGDHVPKDGGPPWMDGPGALHWGCRSTSIPILKSWRDLGIDEDEVPETTRSSMDGQVPQDLSFEGWLKKQSAARQDTVLGNGKAALWRAGKISFRDLLDQNGRPLTTEELRAKYAT